MFAKYRSTLYTVILMVMHTLCFSDFAMADPNPQTGAGVANASSAKSVLDIQHWKTPQGVPVYFVHTPEIPMVDIEVMFKAGSAHDKQQFGLAKFTNGMLEEGADGLTADQIAQRFDDVGAQFGFDVNQDMSSVALRSLTDPKFLEPALQTFTQVLNKPDFPQNAFNRVKAQALTALQQELQTPSAIAKRAFLKTLYDGQPYGHPSLGSTETIKPLSREDVLHFYKKYYVTQNAIIAIVGDVSQEKAQQIAQQLTQSLPSGQPAETIAMAQAPTKSIHDAIPFAAEQTTILLGQVGITPNDADYFPLTLGNYILGGGGLVSELFDQVREQRGLAYGVGSQFIPLAARGPFLVFLQTRTAEAQNAVNLTQQVLTHYIQNGPTAEKLAAAKRSIVGGFPLKISSNSDILAQISYIAFYNLPLNYLDTFREKIEAITQDQIRVAMQKHIQPDAFITVTVGNADFSSHASTSAKTQASNQ